jgi:hypothetical protein
MSKYSDVDGRPAAYSGLYRDWLRRISGGQGNGPMFNF